MVDLEVVAVLRQCRRCGEWKPISKFTIGGRVCSSCIGRGTTVRCRSIAITPLGHADLKRWRAEEAAAVA